MDLGSPIYSAAGIDAYLITSHKNLIMAAIEPKLGVTMRIIM